MSAGAPLRSGENRPWDDARVTVYVAGATVSALLLDDGGRALAVAWVGEGATIDGVQHLPGATAGVSALLDDVPAGVARVLVVATDWRGEPIAQVLRTDGTVAYTVTASGLTDERALVMAEVYRRQGAWKVRAVAQGYAGGLAQLAATHGAVAPSAPAPVAVVVPPPPPPPPTPSPVSTAPAAAPPVGTTEQDPVRLIGMILDDASRTTASFESSASFADDRLERDLEAVVGDPSLRMGPAGDAARAAAHARRDELVAQARVRHRADLEQLRAELAGLEARLPASLAPWGAASWHDGQPGETPAFAVRLGEISHPSAPDLRLPVVRPLPLHPAVWIETDDGGDQPVGPMVDALVSRLALATPHARRLTVIDVGGRRGLAHLPTAEPVITDPARASQVLQEHAEHVGLVTLARQSGGLGDLPPEHRPGRALVVTDVPGGLDDAAVSALQRLVAEGAAAALDLVVAGRRPHALGIPVLDAVHGACLRVPTAPGGDLVDAYGGLTWTFHPDLGPSEPADQQRVRAVVARRVAG